MVRDLGRDLKKSIAFVPEGGETELDKSVLQVIHDPLVHLIRNCADHGLETPEERTAAGKPTQGVIRTTASQIGSHIVITLQDDGRGLNAALIRQKAVQNGILQDNKEIPEDQVFSLIFHPGLSTKDQASTVSGRGVGMDVVKKNVESIHGSIAVKSKKNAGVTFIIRLPLTVAIIDGFIIQVDIWKFVIPLTSVREFVQWSQVKIDPFCNHNGNLLRIRDDVTPFLRLRELFNWPGKSPSPEHVVIVGYGTKRLALLVDCVIGKSQLVVKPLSKVFQNARLFSGATILGDGASAPILDVERIIDDRLVDQ